MQEGITQVDSSRMCRGVPKVMKSAIVPGADVQQTVLLMRCLMMSQRPLLLLYVIRVALTCRALVRT